MKTKIVIAFTALISLIGGSLAVAAPEGVQTLRGSIAIDEPSAEPQLTKWRHDDRPIKRQYVQQPPLIPHKVDNYVINKKVNKCLSCHSWANYKLTGATKISLTHYTNRDGVEMSNVAGRRYFCLQCHVPQKQVDPLVNNTFKPIEILNGH